MSDPGAAGGASDRLFARLGFRWDRARVPRPEPASAERAVFRYRQSLPEFVYDAGALEGNPFTRDEVRALMDGGAAGGHSLSDERQILNLTAAAEELAALVRSSRFRLAKPVSDRLHGLTASEEALEWGHFRGEGRETEMTPHVLLGRRGTHAPPPTRPGAAELKELFRGAAEALETHAANPLERGMAWFLTGALHQFYFDGNKRTARFMMNGILMAAGHDAISVPAARAAGFDAAMAEFYLTKDASGMMAFLAGCRPRDAAAWSGSA